MHADHGFSLELELEIMESEKRWRETKEVELQFFEGLSPSSGVEVWFLKNKIEDAGNH